MTNSIIFQRGGEKPPTRQHFAAPVLVPRSLEALPVPALRGDLGALLTAARFLPRLAAAGPWGAAQLTDPFAETVQRWGGIWGGVLKYGDFFI